jgi:molecular chaperone GrpE
MPESAPPGVPAHAAVNGPEALTPQAVEALLADFRSWLQAGGAAESPPEEPDEEPIDLHTLLAQFVALRHEVNLQTRASRAQQEQNGEALRQLEEALRALRESRSAAPPEAEEQTRPLLKTLVDLYDALALARREVQRVQETALPVFDEFAGPDGTAAERQAPENAPAPPLLYRLFGGGWAERKAEAALQAVRQQQQQTAEAAGRARAFLDSVITGYTMSLQRVERALHQYGLEPIPCVGQPFDPERMEVLEVMGGTGRPANEVLDEVRRGYLWNGRVFRYAQVRVAKG